MTSKTHDIGAVAALLTVYRFNPGLNLGVATIVVGSIANIVGALIPDMDQASNRLWDLVPGGNLTGKILRNIFLAHRTLSHSILGIFLTYKVSGWVIFKIFNSSFVDPTMVFYALMIGYLSHIILDGLTEEGVPLLFPIKWKFGFPPWKHLRIKTGHWVEKWLVFPGLTLYVLMVLGKSIFKL